MEETERGEGGLDPLTGAAEEQAGAGAAEDLGLVGVGAEIEYLVGPEDRVGAVGGRAQATRGAYFRRH